MLYFAGHGYTEDTGGYLCSSDSQTGEDGIALQDIMTWANQSEFRNCVIILDSCHSGEAGTRSTQRKISEISEGVTILTASTGSQYADETGSGGVFTNSSGRRPIRRSMQSGWRDYRRNLRPCGSISRRLGTAPHVQNECRKLRLPAAGQAANDLHYLQRIPEFFPSSGYESPLDPSFEPERSEAEQKNPTMDPPVNTAIFALLQDYARVGLLRPEGQPHMWHAAVFSAGAKLTRLGEHYRELAVKGRL